MTVEPRKGRPVAATAQNLVLVHPEHPEITHTLELIDKAVADHYLTKLPERQRSLARSTVNQYAGDMDTGDFQYAGDPIRFNGDGELIDGQHRLQAILQSGHPLWMMVIRGLSNDTIEVVDGGKGRSFTDMLQIHEVKNASAVSALTKKVEHWLVGNYAEEGMGRSVDSQNVHARLSNRQLWHCYQEHTDMIASSAIYGANVGMWARQYNRGTCPGSTFAFAHLMLSRLDVFAADKFFIELRGDGASQALRVLAERIKKGPGRDEKISGVTWLHWIFGTWNHWLDGTSQQTLRRPTPPRFDTLAFPVDPKADERTPEWEPLS